MRCCPMSVCSLILFVLKICLTLSLSLSLFYIISCFPWCIYKTRMLSTLMSPSFQTIYFNHCFIVSFFYQHFFVPLRFDIFVWSKWRTFSSHIVTLYRMPTNGNVYVFEPVFFCVIDKHGGCCLNRGPLIVVFIYFAVTFPFTKRNGFCSLYWCPVTELNESTLHPHPVAFFHLYFWSLVSYSTRSWQVNFS